MLRTAAIFGTLAILSILTGADWSSARAAAPEIRGTWLTTTSSDDWSAANLPTTMTSLKQVGLNTVYVEAWKNGFTNYTSPTLAAFTGSGSLNPSLGGRQLLGETRAAAANAGLIHGAWFEYGSMAQYLGNTGTATGSFNALARKCRDATWTVGTTSGTGWLLKDSSGNYTTASNGFVWMNPLVPEVRNLLKGIVVDAINAFDLQIVQFDDHLAWPQAFGWDDYTKAVYKQETNRNLPSSSTDASFLAWRQGKTQALFAEIADAAKAAKPSVIVSLAPSVIATSSSSYSANWSTWLGKTDEVLPQVYRSTIASFNVDWPSQITASGTNRGELGAGLRLLGTGSATPWSDLQQQIAKTRTDGALGHSIWYSEGLSASGTINPSNYRTQLAAYYDVATNGPAANPHFTSVRWSGSGGSGGSGTWSTLASTWKERSTIWVQDAVGIFDGVGGTVMVSGTVGVAGGLDFRADGYLVTGGTIALRGFTPAANAIMVASGVVATIASPLTGTTGFTKTGAGTLALAGAGSMSAPTSVLGGVLRLDAAGPLSGSHVTPLAGGTLTIASRLAATIGGLSPNAGGLTDVRDGSMTVASGLAAADLVTALVAGRSGGSWAAASGIASSAVAADVAAGLPRAVGWLDNGDGSLTFAYSAVGDSNLDGLVDVVDAANMLTSGKFNSGGSAVWTEGDFNYDGSFDVLDAADFIAAGSFNAGPYQTTVAEHPAAQVAVVPEPASSAFVAMAAVMGLVLSRGAARRR